jgi:hypothetical protein
MPTNLYSPLPPLDQQKMTPPAAETAARTAAGEGVGSSLESMRPLDEPGAVAPTAAFEGDGDASDEIEHGYADEIQAPPIMPVELDRELPPLTRGRFQAPEPDKPGDALDVESVAARRTRLLRGSWRWPLSRLQTGMLALALLDVIVVGWRTDVVRALPQTASFYSLMGLPVNLRGLAFDSLATLTEQHEGVPILVVEGNVVNAARRNEDVPRLKFILRNAAQHEIYSWTTVPVLASLSPGESEGFRTRLASPPADARDVVVRFVNRHDLLASR